MKQNKQTPQVLALDSQRSTHACLQPYTSISDFSHFLVDSQYYLIVFPFQPQGFFFIFCCTVLQVVQFLSLFFS